MGRPKLVYLDSSDWSKLAAAMDPEPFAERERWLDVRQRLLAARDANLAEFRFSQAIIIEAYPTSASHRAQGIARARAIAELCGPLCFLEANTLTRQETRMLALGARPPFDRSISLRDDNGWHADPDEFRGRFGTALTLDARSTVGDLLKEDLPHLSKRNRRQIENELFDRSGRLVGPARDRLLDPAVQQELSRTVSAKFGLPHDTPGFEVLGRVMAGQLPPEVADKWLIDLLRDLPTLFSLISTHEQAKQFFGYLRRAGQSIAAPISEAADRMKQFVADFGLDTARRLYAGRPWLDTLEFRTKTRERVLSRMWEVERRQRGQGPRVRGEAWFRYVHDSPFGSIPTLDAYLAAGAALMGKASVISKQPYAGRESDAGDVLHMSYLPYVDVFRCDRGNAQVAQAVVSELALRAKIAPTMDELLNLVEGAG